MTATRTRPDATRVAVAVALRATLVVAVVYLLIAAAVVAFAARTLTDQVDARLARSLEEIRRGPGLSVPAAPPGEPLLGPQLALWIVTPGGDVLSPGDQPALPPAYGSVTAPTTVTVEGQEVRVAGTRIGGDVVIVGESMEPVTDARDTIIVGELLVAPILLASVFAGSLAVGRRVAAPIDRARQRQVDFTADASHELRTPLSVIEANASLALARERDVDWYQGTFAKVDGEARRMRRLLDDMLWLARFDAAEQLPPSGAVDLGVLARQTADRFAPVAESRSLVLDVRAEDDHVTVDGPPDWLDRLLGVLLDNACKYSPAGGTVTVSVSGGQHVVLTVDDAGPGIPVEERGRIFDRFRRANDGAHGAGLGLAIADAIVRATGGRWGVGRSPAGGARMSVSWPRAD